MDPDTAWCTMTDRRIDLEDRADSAAALMSWLDSGGFPPIGAADSDQARFTAATIVAEAWRAR